VQWPFILYGDSLTEIWKGTMGCKPSSQRAGFDALRQQYLSPLSNADGMSGEPSTLPRALCVARSPASFVSLMGCRGGVLTGVQTIVCIIW
jgi:hypothetical protein